MRSSEPRSGIRAPSLAALASVLLATSSARADAKTPAEVTAEELFREGTRLLEGGRFGDACPKLEESLKLDAALGTLLYVAACHEKQGLNARAWREFAAAAEWGQKANRFDRVLFARKHQASLEAKMSMVLIHAPALAGLELRIDDESFTASALGTPIPLDPGKHEIEVTAPGYASWHTSLAVAARQEKLTLTVPPMVPGPAPPHHEATESTPEAPAEPAASPATPSDAPVLIWVAAGVAGSGLLVGSIFGALTLSERDNARSECPANRCVPGGLDDIDRARTYATVSTLAFGVGLAAAVATAYLWVVRATSSSSPDPAGPTLAPGVSPGQASLSLVGRFE